MSETDFDGWLEARLGAQLPIAETAPSTPRYLVMRRPGIRGRLAALGALAGGKLLAGTTVIALAGAGVGVKTAVTGSPNPFDWNGRHAVQTCQATQQPGPGFGQCVSNEVHATAPGAGNSGTKPGHDHTPPAGPAAGHPATPGASGDHGHHGPPSGTPTP